MTNHYLMNNLLYLIAVILVIGWAVTYLGLGIATNLIHVLLILAVISVLFNVIRRGQL